MDYVVRRGTVVLVDEFTGRVAENRYREEGEEGATPFSLHLVVGDEAPAEPLRRGEVGRGLDPPGAGDGTTGRGVPGKHPIGPGSTIVLFDSADPGLLEIQAPDEVAVHGELRNTALPGPAEVFGLLPAVGSRNAAQAGATLVLQGPRPSSLRAGLGSPGGRAQNASSPRTREW